MISKRKKHQTFFYGSKNSKITKDIHFGYKFKDGISPESCELEVAKLLGLQQKVLVWQMILK